MGYYPRLTPHQKEELSLLSVEELQNTKESSLKVAARSDRDRKYATCTPSRDRARDSAIYFRNRAAFCDELLEKANA